MKTSVSSDSSVRDFAAAAVATTKQARRPYKGAATLPRWWLEVTPHDVRLDPEDVEKQLHQRAATAVQFYAQIAVPLQDDAAPVSPLTDSSDSRSDDDLAEASMYLLSKSRLVNPHVQSSSPHHLRVPQLESNGRLDHGLQCSNMTPTDETHSVPHRRSLPKTIRGDERSHADTLPPNTFSAIDRHHGQTAAKQEQSSRGLTQSQKAPSSSTSSPKNPMDPRSPHWDPTIWGIDRTNPQFELYQRGELLPERYVLAVVRYAQSIGIVDQQEEKTHRLDNHESSSPSAMSYSVQTIWKIIEQLNQMVEC